MKTFVTFITALTLWTPAQAYSAADMSSTASKLSGMPQYSSEATYEVLLPTSEFPVVYNISLASVSNDNSDSLAIADYLIEWSLKKDGNTSEGFASYFNGHHYRYRDQRLQEYHYVSDALPFSPGGLILNGVQNQAQFCDLLPQYMGQTFSAMISDSTYKFTVHPDTIISKEHVTVIDGVRSFQGIEALEFSYILDAKTLKPIKSEFVSNPGQIGEQLITATYKSADTPLTVAKSEDDLRKRYPEVFEKYRESSFTLENMPGRKLPAFSAPTTTGERYTHEKNSGFATPTVIAILDAEVGSTAKTITMLRDAVASLPMETGLILAFVNNNVDMIEPLVGQIRQGEHLLMSARGLARDCGISSTPVILICDSSATVKDLINGFNNDITDFVIQKTALIAK